MNELNTLREKLRKIANEINGINTKDMTSLELNIWEIVNGQTADSGMKQMAEQNTKILIDNA